MNKISIIIPHLDLSNTNEVLRECLNSLKGKLSKFELIIVLDEIGYAKSVNTGLEKARGDYLFVINNDTKVINGNLEKMLEPNAITVPLIIPEPRDYMPRCFFCVPRKIYNRFLEKDGYFYDERFFPGYFEDDDLIKRIERDNVEVHISLDVKIEHKDGGGLTMKQFGEQECFNINKERFEEKWRVKV